MDDLEEDSDGAKSHEGLILIDDLQNKSPKTDIEG